MYRVFGLRKEYIIYPFHTFFLFGLWNGIG